MRPLGQTLRLSAPIEGPGLKGRAPKGLVLGLRVGPKGPKGLALGPKGLRAWAQRA